MVRTWIMRSVAAAALAISALAPAAAEEFAVVTSRSGTVQFGLVISESTDVLVLRSLKSLKDSVFAKADILSSKRDLKEEDAFAREELPYVLAWRLSTITLKSADGSARPGRLVVVPFAAESGVSGEVVWAYYANVVTVAAQRKIEVPDKGEVQKALAELSVQDPLTPPAVPLGVAMKADWVCTGRIVLQDKVHTLHYRVVDVKSQRTLVAGSKPLAPAGPSSATLPAAKTPEKQTPPAKPPELEGQWEIQTNNIKIKAAIVALEPGRFAIHAPGVYAGQYEWRKGSLAMVKPSSPTYSANSPEMIVWRMRGDGSLVIANTRWAGYTMSRTDAPAVGGAGKPADNQP